MGEAEGGTMSETRREPAGITYTALCRALVDAVRADDHQRRDRVFQAIETIAAALPEAVAIEDKLWGASPCQDRGAG